MSPPEVPPLPSPPSLDAACSSGTSPTPATLHLIGAGNVGRALLRRLADLERPVRIVAASDRSGTVFAPKGLDPRELAGWKESGRSFAEHPRGAAIELDVALAVADAGIVVDCSTSELAPAARAAAGRRTRFLLDQGRHVVLAAKTPLLADWSDHVAHGPRRGPAIRLEHWNGATLTIPQRTDHVLWDPKRRSRLHVNAVFGGTGAALLSELDELRSSCREIACVPNATTGVVLDARARGATLREAIAAAQALGLAESEPLQDLDGRDAALKLVLLARAVFETEFDPGDVERPTAREGLALRPSRGRAIRLVGRVERGRRPRLAWEEVEPALRLATRGEQVVYCYALRSGATRVHVGVGVGAEGTAGALLADLRRALGIDAGAAERTAA
jgi:homoserine dehydrogenase